MSRDYPLTPRQCVSAITLPAPWMLAQCALDMGHKGDHKTLIEWDDDLEPGDPS